MTLKVVFLQPRYTKIIMKHKITPDPISWTTLHLHFCFEETDLVISSGTGFIYKHEDKLYLITNWHNVAGRNPITNEYLSKDTQAVPDVLSTLFRSKDTLGNGIRDEIKLYEDDQMFDPVWLEHPIHGKDVDVVAIPIATEIAEKYMFFAINDVDFDSKFKEEVADEVYVIGYPFFDITYAQLPIWKKGSIASEPDINIDQKPKMLIDTATRSGLSGSPVIMQRIGIHGMKDGKMADDSLIGRIRNFVGVYSGRIGDDELKAQLGIVWKKHVIDEIIEGNKRAPSPHI